MRRIFLAVFSFFLALPVAAECVGDNLLETLTPAQLAQLDTQIARHPYPSGNIWQAQKPGSTVHVVGTFHLYDPRTAAIIETATNLIETADGAFFEVLEEDEAYMQKRLTEELELGFIVDGPTLLELLSPEEWAELKSRAVEAGIPGFLAAKMKPWVIGMSLGIPLCANIEAKSNIGMDPALIKVARSANVPVRALDDIDELLAVLDKGTLEEQLSDLKLGMWYMGDTTSQYVTTLESYLDGNHRLIWEFAILWATRNEGPDNDRLRTSFSELEADLLIARNQKWMKKLLPEIADGTFVIAVGAGHLSGESGILHLLERSGYNLTPVAY